MYLPSKKTIETFLDHSNRIESEYSKQALEDALKAWEYAYKNRDNVTIDYMLQIHKILTRNIAPHIGPGKIRKCDIWIGGNIKFFISEALIKEDLNEVCELMNRIGSESVTKKIHVMFENVHPFEDGNGRTGRILYNIHRLKSLLPIDIIHEGEEQMEYYKWFK